MNSSTARTAQSTVREKSRNRRQLPPHLVSLLGFVYQHRYVTTEQIHTRFRVTSQRTIYHQVARLQTNGYLAEVPLRNAASSHPRVFITTGKAHRVIAERYEQITGRAYPGFNGEQRRPTRGYADFHIDHELDVTWFDLAMHHHVAGRDDLSLKRTERRYYQEPPQRDGQTPIPDAGYYLIHDRGGRRYFEWCVLEFDRGTMSAQRIYEKLDRYHHWTTAPIGQQTLAGLHNHYGDTTTREPTYRLLFVVRARPGEGTDLHRLAVILAEAIKLPWAMRRRIWLTTAADFEEHGRDLAAPIWLQTRQAGRWLPDYRQLLADLHPKDHARHGRAFITGQLTAQARYSLFPPPSTAPGHKPPGRDETS